MIDLSFLRTSHLQRHFYAYYQKDTSEQRETDNSYDSFAVAITKNDTIIGHVPRSTSRLKYFHRAILNSPPRVERKNVKGYTGNYVDTYFQGLLSICEILKIFYPQK